MVMTLIVVLCSQCGALCPNDAINDANGHWAVNKRWEAFITLLVKFAFLSGFVSKFLFCYESAVIVMSLAPIPGKLEAKNEL